MTVCLITRDISSCPHTLPDSYTSFHHAVLRKQHSRRGFSTMHSYRRLHFLLQLCSSAARIILILSELTQPYKFCGDIKCRYSSVQRLPRKRRRGGACRFSLVDISKIWCVVYIYCFQC